MWKIIHQQSPWWYTPVLDMVLEKILEEKVSRDKEGNAVIPVTSMFLLKVDHDRPSLFFVLSYIFFFLIISNFSEMGSNPENLTDLGLG